MSKRAMTQPLAEKRLKLASQVILESSMGISKYIETGTEINAIIKHRYQDFHVHELSKGEIVVLKNLEYQIVEEQVSELTNEAKCKEISEFVQDSEFAKKLLEIVESKQGSVTIDIPEKEKRTQIHTKIRSHFGSFLDSKTNGETIEISVFKGKKLKRNKSWKELGGEYCHFTMQKENRDTMDSIHVIAKMLRMNPKIFSFAGTKDRRAVTCQRISVHRGRAEQLCRLNDRLYGIKLGDFTYEKKGLSLADSKGNHFKIALRQVHPKEPSLLLKRLESLKEKGFLNYYGMQRFGTQLVGTHQVGIAMLADNWKKAFELLVGGQDQVEGSVTATATTDEVIPESDDEVGLDIDAPEESGKEVEDSEKARAMWVETRNARKTYNLFPRQATAERHCLASFMKQYKDRRALDKIDYVQIIQSIPKNLRLMYVHAYQSRVWNEMASKRHELYGQVLVLGDLVRVSKVDIDGIGNRSDEMQVELVTKQNFTKYSVFDMVLPLPGHSVLYPKNEIENEYQKYMAQEGFDPHKMERKVHETNLPGSYRSVYVKPQNVSGTPVFYDGEPESLIGYESKGKEFGFVVEFSLGSSQYATMALRELLKTETSASFHSVLSQASK